MQMFPVVNLSTSLSTSMINLAIRDDSCNSAMNQVELLAGDPGTGYIMSSYTTSSQVTKTFPSITSQRIEIEPWVGFIVFSLS